MNHLYTKNLVCSSHEDILYDMSICLSMIVKNEAHCIARCLEHVKPFITHWVICDTGSIDNTEEVVKECLKDIPGEYHKHKWQDFATNRNKGIQLSKDKADYTLIIDADDLLIAHPSAFDNLSALAYQILILHNNIAHYRPQLIHNSVDFKYIGVVHEYMEVPSYVAQQALSKCHILVSRDGSRSQDPLKYLKDAELLENEIAKDPNNARYVFYCAQSFRDYGSLENALKYYRKRTTMSSGFEEERYCSYLEAGKIMERITPDDLKGITTTYLKAHECNPQRIESLCYLAAYYRRQNLLPGAYAFAKLGTTIKKPQNALFLEPECYDWKIWDEVAVSGFYIGQKEEATLVNKRLLADPRLPADTRGRIITNLEFCEGKR